MQNTEPESTPKSPLPASPLPASPLPEPPPGSVSPLAGRTPAPRSLPLPRALQGFLALIALLTCVSAAIEAVCRFFFGLGYPYDWPFVAPVSRFDDLLSMLPRFQSLRTQAFFEQLPRIVYPAPVDVLYAVFLRTGRWALTLYMALAAATALTALLTLGRRMGRAGLSGGRVALVLSLLLLTSYPFWFLLHTANFELVVWICMLAGIYAQAGGREKTAASCFGVAAAMKVYPVLFLALYLRRGKWLLVLQGLGVAAAVLGVSLWVVDPHIGESWRQMRLGMDSFVQADGLHRLYGQIGFDHSVFALLKLVLPPMNVAHTARLLTLYVAAAGLAATLLWFRRVSRLPFLEQTLFLTVAMIALPPVSYDYTLVHLYAGWALLILPLVRGERLSRAGTIALGCFAILFTAQGYIIAFGNHFAAQLKCLALLTLAGVAAHGGLFTGQLHDRPSSAAGAPPDAAASHV